MKAWLLLASAVAVGGLIERVVYYFILLDRVIP